MSTISSLFLVLVACNNKVNNSKVMKAIIEKPLTEDVSFVKVPVYDYASLSKRYFENQNDTIYVVNFWATWCKPCIKELPAFEKLNETFNDQPVKVVLVSLDFPDKLETGVIPFIEKNKLQSEVVLLDDADANSWIPKVSEQWSGAIPATLFIKNTTNNFFEKSFTFKELQNQLLTLL